MKKQTAITLTLNTMKEQVPLSEYLRLVAEKRQAKFKPIVMENFPPIQTLQERIAYGLLSWTLMNRGERWIKPKAAIYGKNGIQTGSEIARDYLDYYHPKRLKATGSQARSLLEHRSAPLYCVPGFYPDMVYVDVKSAFWQITNLVGWDVDYNPFKWIRPGRAPIDFPYPEHRTARNCLVSCCLPTPMKVWTGSKFIRERKQNVHINLCLWSIIMDTLHCIASLAVQHSAVYVHTDGCIIPQSKAVEFVERVREFGITAVSKPDSAGECYMFGLGDFKCGTRVTKLFNRSRLKKAVSTLYFPDDTLIKRKLRKFFDNPSMTMY